MLLIYVAHFSESNNREVIKLGNKEMSNKTMNDREGEKNALYMS